jgi:hypothetical protein
MPGHGERLSRKQEEALAALLISPTIGAAAKRVGCHSNSLRRWLKTEEFAAAYAAARQQLLATTVRACQVALCSAVARMKRDLRSADPEIRYRAARLLLDAFCGATDRGVVLERLKRLEDQLGRGRP